MCALASCITTCTELLQSREVGNLAPVNRVSCFESISLILRSG